MQPHVDLSSVKDKLSAEVYVFQNPVTQEISIITGYEAAQRISVTQGRTAGRLHTGKPPMDREVVERVRHGFTNKYYTSPLLHCAGAQVWRLVAFEVSSIAQHYSLPVMVGFDCPVDMGSEEMRKFSYWCQKIADIVLKTFPHKPGLQRWSSALRGY
jgi:hypothetical protein